MHISKEQLNQSFKNKHIIELEDLVHIIEESFGYHVTLNRKDAPCLTDDQKVRMNSVIFKDEDVLYQLGQAKKDRDAGISTYSDDEEEFMQLVKEVRNET